MGFTNGFWFVAESGAGAAELSVELSKGMSNSNGMPYSEAERASILEAIGERLEF